MPFASNPSSTATLSPPPLSAPSPSSEAKPTSSPPSHPLHHPSYTSTGSGTPVSPYIVSFFPGDPDNPREWRNDYRWLLSSIGSIQMFAITFATSCYTGGYPGMLAELGSSHELSTGGLATYSAGLGAGGLIFAPASEICGRRIIALGTLSCLSLFGMGVALSPNIGSVLVCRFFMGFFGSSVLANSPGMLNDIRAPSEISLPLTINSVMPFLGPCLGPIIGGYISQYAGPRSWRWVNGVIAMLAAFVTILSFLIPETYPVKILRRRANALGKDTGLAYVTSFEAGRPRPPLLQRWKTALGRPYVFLCLEPIVIALSLYAALVFGVLYLFFDAYPIIFQEERGWSSGVGALPFLGLALGLFIGVPISIFTARIFRRASAASPTGKAPPEQRLYFAMVSSLLLPLSLYWMAFTSPTHIHWAAPTFAGVPFGIGMLGMMTSVMAYLADTYTIYSASVFAANSLFRYIAGAVFPLFASYMFQGMTTRWALFLLACVALLCAPLPWIFFKYGHRIRALSKHAPPQPSSPSQVQPNPSSTPSAANPPTPKGNFADMRGEQSVAVERTQKQVEEAMEDGNSPSPMGGSADGTWRKEKEMKDLEQQ